MSSLTPWFHGLVHGLVGSAILTLTLYVAHSNFLNSVTLAGAILWVLHWLENKYLA